MSIDKSSNLDITHKLPKNEEGESMADFEKATKYWQDKLRGETEIETPQSKDCQFAIVIPIFNELFERILNQIESLKKQEGVDPSEFEIIYVVNNDLPDSSEKSEAVINANKNIIEKIREISGLNIFVVDKSSAGNEIPNCNVGRARNRGVAEASWRFHQNSKDGIIVQTDADSYFEDPQYLQKLKGVMDSDPNIIGAAGGLIFEFSPDAQEEKDIDELQKKVERLLLIKKWNILMKFFKNPGNPIAAADKNFSGANMISRSYETAVIGGLIDASSGEDPKFGMDLTSYAEKNGKNVIGLKKDLRMVTAIRESDRTDSSFKKDFDKIDLNESTMVEDPTNSSNKIELTEENYNQLLVLVKKMPGGESVINFVEDIVKNTRINRKQLV